MVALNQKIRRTCMLLYIYNTNDWYGITAYIYIILMTWYGVTAYNTNDWYGVTAYEN